MKILSYLEEDGMLIVTTDFALMPVFVYPADKFNNLADLEKEIEAKIKEVEVRKQKKTSRIEQLKSELDAKVK